MYKNSTCRLQAHRGVSTDAPENTLVAYSLAKEQGYDLIEVDPKFTKDNVCVMLHDRTLNRTARINGKELDTEVKIVDVSYSELENMDFGLWMSEEFAGTKIPTLEQTLKLAAELDIEMKIDNVIERFTEEQQNIVFGLVNKYGKRVGMTAKTLDFLEKAAKAVPCAYLHYDGLVDDSVLDRLDSIAKGRRLYVWARMDNANSTWCTVPAVDATLAAKIKEHALLGIWILSEESEMQMAIELGADVVETNGSIKP